MCVCVCVCVCVYVCVCVGGLVTRVLVGENNNLINTKPEFQNRRRKWKDILEDSIVPWVCWSLRDIEDSVVWVDGGSPGPKRRSKLGVSVSREREGKV